MILQRRLKFFFVLSTLILFFGVTHGAEKDLKPFDEEVFIGEVHAHEDLKKLIVSPSFSDLYSGELAYFPKSYEESRGRFLQHINRLASEVKEAKTDRFLVPSPIYGDTDLTVDSIYIPPRKEEKGLLVIVSGTHGAEAFVGAAFQELFLKDFLPQLLQSQKNDSLGILVVHSLNPFGMKYMRRPTENNVDLNRNYPVKDDQYEIKRPAYADFYSVLNPPGSVDSLNWPVFSFLKLLWQSVFGSVSVGEIFAGGQYEHNKGIYFGGQKKEPQVAYIVEKLNTLAKNYESLMVFDLHTGLGKTRLQYMKPAYLSEEKLEDYKKMFDGFFLTPNSAYTALGDFVDYTYLAFPKKRVYSATLEFGTLGESLKHRISTMNRIIKENQGYQFGYEDSYLQKAVKNRFAELFYPRSKEWRRMVLCESRNTLSVLVPRFQRSLGDEVPIGELEKCIN